MSAAVSSCSAPQIFQATFLRCFLPVWWPSVAKFSQLLQNHICVSPPTHVYCMMWLSFGRPGNCAIARIGRPVLSARVGEGCVA